jgi:SAM-dependent methyltransferase
MDRIGQHYDENPEREWARLEAQCPTEFAVTLRALAEYLPPPPAVVYDIGGGPGRYAIELARHGYTVTLVDLSQGLLDLGAKRAAEAEVTLAGTLHANALNLSALSSDSAGAVLLLGPLYHLQEQHDREQAAREAVRVLRPGGRIFAAFANRYTWHLALARIAPERLISWKDRMDVTMATGRIDPTDWTPAYFAHPSEIRPLMEGAGLETLSILATDGLIRTLDERPDLPDDVREAVIDLCYCIGQDESVLGAAGHLLYVGQKVTPDGRATCSSRSDYIAPHERSS